MLRKVKLFLFKKQWRKKNPHNQTSAGNFFKQHNVMVGKETYGQINVVAPNNDKIEIGNYVSIAQDVHFVLGTHDYRRITTYPMKTKIYQIKTDDFQKIVVEDDVWIGYGATILTGVTIGKGAVIAANSVVAKDVPPYAIWIGNKVAKFRFDERIRQKLYNIDYGKICHKKGDEFEQFCLSNITDENIDEIMSAFIKG